MNKPKILTHFLLFTIIFSCKPSDDNTVTVPPIKKEGSIVITYEPGGAPITFMTLDDENVLNKLTTYGSCSEITNRITKKEGTYILKAESEGKSWRINIDVEGNNCQLVELKTSNATITKVNGEVIFSSNGESGVRDITVEVNGETIGVIKETLEVIVINPPEDNNFKKEYKAGNYSYKAISQNGHTWQGSFEIEKGVKTFVTLMKFNAEPIKNGFGKIVINSTKYRNIIVNLNNEYTGKITVPYEANTLDMCVRKWNVSIIKPLGTYNYSASDNSGHSWSGSVTLKVSGGCVVINLN